MYNNKISAWIEDLMFFYAGFYCATFIVVTETVAM